MEEQTGRGSGSFAYRAVVAALLAVVAIGVLAAVADGAEKRDGYPDREFGLFGRAAAPLLETRPDLSLAEGPGGTLLAGTEHTIVRFKPNGKLDKSFAEQGTLKVWKLGGKWFEIADISVDSTGRIVAFGKVEEPDALIEYSLRPHHAAVARFTASGHLDPSFGEGDGFYVGDLGQPDYPGDYDKAVTSAVQGTALPDGRILVAGTVAYPTGGHGYPGFEIAPRVVAAITNDGRLDTSVGEGGVLLGPNRVSRLTHVAFSPEGEMAVRARIGSRGYRIFKFTREGNLDITFGRNGIVADHDRFYEAMDLGPRGEIVMASSREVIRLEHNGRPDKRFGNRGRAEISMPGESELSSVKVDDRGRVLASGTQAVRVPGSRKARRSYTVIALNRHGHPDRRFGRGGWIATRFGAKSTLTAHASLIPSTDHLLVGGFATYPGNRDAISLVRYDLGD